MQKLEPPDFSKIPRVIDLNDIPGIDYYLDAWKEPDSGYPSRPNSYSNLTAEGCIEAANLMGPRFKEIWDKSTEIMYGKREYEN